MDGEGCCGAFAVEFSVVVEGGVGEVGDEGAVWDGMEVSGSLRVVEEEGEL